MQALADQGVLFREAFCAAPTCSASRACLLTGQYGQSNGMLGLAHRGWSLRDYSHHIVHTLRKVGYTSTLIGEQHISKDPQAIGYDEVVKVPTTRVESVAPLAMDVLRRERDRPLFLSVGFFETHREFLGPGSLRDVQYSKPPNNLPDAPEVRADVAAFKASARSLDHGVGVVLNELDAGRLGENTLIIFTTDHGMPFPGAKATLYDRGLGVDLILRGPEPFGGGRVLDELVSHIDLYTTVCEYLEIERPPFLQAPAAMDDRHRRSAARRARRPAGGRRDQPARPALRRRADDAHRLTEGPAACGCECRRLSLRRSSPERLGRFAWPANRCSAWQAARSRAIRRLRARRRGCRGRAARSGPDRLRIPAGRSSAR